MSGEILPTTVRHATFPRRTQHVLPRKGGEWWKCYTTEEYRAPEASIEAFYSNDLLSYLPYGAASGAIEKTLRDYIGLHGRQFSVEHIVQQKSEHLFVSTVSAEMERAIVESKSAVTDPNPDLGDVYTETTWERATGLLREMAELFWIGTADYLPVPSIGPAMDRSIDLFWEIGDLTLLVNIPEGAEKGVTFFGRRSKDSKISGVLGAGDMNPKHLTGWLSRRE